MEKPVKIVYHGGQGEIIEKKSRFIASVRPVFSEEEAQAFIESARKRYWDARHNCSAYVIGERNEITRCSDDGEPAGTAGRPMLEVLLGENMRNTCVVVTRYFGGVLLGTGGLVRAYGSAVREGLRASRVLERRIGKQLEITCDYSLLGKVQYLAASHGLYAGEIRYEAEATLQFLAEDHLLGGFEKAVADMSAGKLPVVVTGTVFFGKDEEGLVICGEP